MNDNLIKYLHELEENTAITMQNEQLSTREESFTTYVLSQIAAKVGANDFQVVHAELKDMAGRYQGEIYAYNESENQEVLTLFYTIYKPVVNNQVVILNDSDIQYAWNRLQGFYEKAIRGEHLDMTEDNDGYDICKLIYDHNSTYQTIRFIVLSNASIKKSEPKKLRIHSKETDTNIWDLKKLAGNLTNTSDHIEINIDFENDPYYKYDIPYLEMASGDSNYRCFLMMFPAKLIYKLYKKWNTDLLLYNVRYWLTFKKTKRKHTNSDIRETLRSEKQMSLAYNNGITAIATNVRLAETNGNMTVNDSDDNYTSSHQISMGMLKAIENFQIVNGGQTTASIFKAKDLEPGKINLTGAFVQVKLVVLSNTDNIHDLASKISKSSNSQNAVKDSDFSVSEQFNTKMQELSRLIRIPNDKGEISYWFFERIRGQYEEELSRNTRKEDYETFKAKFPKENKFSKENVAIAWKSWDMEPFDAVKGAGTTYDLFITKQLETGNVPDEHYYKETIALLIIYNFLKARPENRNYKNAKASVITFTMAYLRYRTFDSIDLLEIWDKQGLTEGQKKALNKLCELVFERLNRLALEEGTTVLSYGKRKDSFPSLCSKITGAEASAIARLLEE